MVEIKTHNPKLRLAVNVALGILFAAFFIFTVVLVALDSRAIGQMRYQLTILHDDVTKKQEALFAADRKFQQARSRMTPRETVEASLKLQDQREKLAGSQEQLTQIEDECDDAVRRRQYHIWWLIFTFIGCPVVFWINYALNY
ncbi:MAG: hypothetical protein B1H03_03965 [Planctomycetales bacterium 4484_113]|nr:MAG: hypothetical protein B1H03_03965 [Planctomycetales bacterium 4484_113]